MRRIGIIVLLLGLIVGIALGSFWYLTNLLVLVWILTGLTAVILISHKHNSHIILLSIFMGAVVVGIYRFNVSILKSVNDVSNFAKQEVVLEGVIVDDPQEDGELIKFALLVKSADDDKNVMGKVLITTRKYPAYFYGNQIVATGSLEIPRQSSTFDYPAYLSRFGIYSTMQYPEIEVVKPFVGNWFLSLLYQAKHRLISVVNYILPEPTAAFLAGLLFGIRSSMPKELLENFNITGLTHIIALSGFNITIIAGALMGWLKYLSVRLKFVLVITAIVSFVLLTGASPSVTRAAIMGIIILWAGLAGRLHDITISILLAAVIMALFNPKILIYDIGFQLSFLSTIGIVYLSPILDATISQRIGWIRGYLGPTLSAIIFVMPVIAYHFGRVSLIAPIANVLVLPLIPLTMGLGFAAIILGLINKVLGMAVGLLAWVPLQASIMVTDFLARVPFASVDMQLTHPGWVIGYYIVLLGLMIYWYGYKTKQNKSMGLNYSHTS